MDRLDSIDIDILGEDDALTREMFHPSAPNPFDQFPSFSMQSIKPEPVDKIGWGPMKEDFDKENEVPFLNADYNAFSSNGVRGQVLGTKSTKTQPKKIKQEFGRESQNWNFTTVLQPAASLNARPTRPVPYHFRVQLPKSPHLDTLSFGTVDIKKTEEKLVFVHSQKHRFHSIRVDGDGIHCAAKKSPNSSTHSSPFSIELGRKSKSPVWSSSNNSSPLSGSL
ncbi:hypothetical protein L596_014662 [Steinernema carpocapsae]|uniref:Uncharacterized protein n=1 Tax=Steinernema carpocapsae TaxID=34508 RepID=A0A4U5NDC6_STECR|nr:hypothetical protein L596_014662 [Steinernema carpocapsae]